MSQSSITPGKFSLYAGRVAVAEVYPEGYEDLREKVTAFLRVVNRLQVEGRENLPPPGQGALLCPNHDGYADPFVLGAAVPHRPVKGLAQETVLNLPVAKQLIKPMGAIPTPTSHGKTLDPAGAQAAMNQLTEYVAAGGLGVVFPEGVVKYWLGGDGLKKFFTGAARVAASAGVPVIPVGIYGCRWVFPNLAFFKGRLATGHAVSLPVYAPAWLPVKVMVKIGEPMAIDPDAATSHEAARRETLKIRRAVFALRQELKARWRVV